MSSDSPRAKGTVRLFFVDAASGRISPVETREDAPLEDDARRLDEALGRLGLSYRSHPRNPAPGQATGYYVYRDERMEADLTDDHVDDQPPIRDFVVVGFVEVAPSLVESLTEDTGIVVDARADPQGRDPATGTATGADELPPAAPEAHADPQAPPDQTS